MKKNVSAMRYKLFPFLILVFWFSSCKVDFSPNAQWKDVPSVYCVLDIDEDNMSIERKWVNWGTRQLYECMVDVSDCDDTYSCLNTVKNALNVTEADSKDLVKVALIGEISAETEFDTEYIRHELSGNYFFIKVNDKTKIKADINKYIDEDKKNNKKVVIGGDMLTRFTDMHRPHGNSGIHEAASLLRFKFSASPSTLSGAAFTIVLTFIILLRLRLAAILESNSFNRYGLVT